MAWQTPKTNWGAADVPLPDDFNRIEGNVQELQNTKETPAGAQAKANTAEANAKAYTDAHEQKAAPHSGHETPAGAQAKASAAAGMVASELTAHKAETATDDVHGLSNVVMGPTASISGNIAIFDGVTGKLIKDSGRNLNANSGYAHYTDTIPKLGEITKTIAIGSGYTYGTLVASYDASLAIVWFSVNIGEAKCVYKRGSSFHVTCSRVSDLTSGSNMVSEDWLGIRDVYIDGSNLKIIFYSAMENLSAYLDCDIYWEVY